MILASGHWSHAHLYSGVACLVTVLPLIFFLEESPRWLLFRGRLSEAASIMEKGKRENGRWGGEETDDKLR